MTPTERRLAKLEQSRPGHFEPWGRVIQEEHETQDEAIKRTYGDGPVPENLIITVIVSPDRASPLRLARPVSTDDLQARCVS